MFNLREVVDDSKVLNVVIFFFVVVVVIVLIVFYFDSVFKYWLLIWFGEIFIGVVV